MLPIFSGSLVGSSVFEARRTDTRFLVEGSDSLMRLRVSIVLFRLAPGESGVGEGSCTEELEILEVGSGIIRCLTAMSVF